MSEKKSEDPKVKKLEIAEESVRELTDAEADQVTGGMMRRGATECGDKGTTMSTCTKVDTVTGVPSTERC